MIKYYDYYTFIRKAKILTQDGIKYLYELDDAIRLLNEEEKEFFSIIKDVFEKYQNNKKMIERLGVHLLVEYSIVNTSYLSYFEYDNYNNLKKNLYDCDIKYTDYSLEEILKYDTNKYDSIYLSNILSHIQNKDKVIIILEELLNKLNISGNIYDYSIDENNALDKYFSVCYMDNEHDIKMIPSGDCFYPGKIIKYKRIK